MKPVDGLEPVRRLSTIYIVESFHVAISNICFTSFYEVFSFPSVSMLRICTLLIVCGPESSSKIKQRNIIAFFLDESKVGTILEDSFSLSYLEHEMNAYLATKTDCDVRNAASYR